MTYDYAREQFTLAVQHLAVDTGRINERLAEAVTEYIGSVEPERDLPDTLQEEFRDALAQLAAVPTTTDTRHGEGVFQATVDTLLEDQATEWAEWIVAFHHQLSAAADAEQETL
jgi:hypothetical protein